MLKFTSVLVLATICQQVRQHRALLAYQQLLPVHKLHNTASRMAQKFVEDKIASGKVVVFSKSYCPFCTMAKKSLRDAGLNDFTVIELDDRGDCRAIQDVLKGMTGASSVPRVFIGGHFVGGGTEMKEMQKNGKLVKLLKEVGAL